MPQTTKINCPKCGHEFNVEDVLAHQIEEKYKKELNSKISAIEGDYKSKEGSLLKKEEELKLQKNDIDKQVEEKVKTESAKKEKEIKRLVGENYEAQIKALSEETSEAKKQIQELRMTKIENEQLKRKIDEQKQTLEVEFEQKMTERLKEETNTIRRRESERVDLKLRERDEVINSMKEQMDEMKRRAEQGSMQLQGEVQELAIEEILMSLFPFDLVTEVPKGVKGADAIQKVRNKIGVDCGIILYESKRTKSFSNEWINKLKSDAVATKADICIIVTEALPEGIDRIGQREGVWICSFNDFRGLVLVLRESLIKISEAYSSQTNKGEKMQMLYDYLMSNEFRLQVGAIIEGFTDLHNGYVQEKRAMERIWKQREKQLEKVLLNTNHFIGSIKGIAGSSIPDLKLIGESDNLLELEG
jgi:hypothetical protein